MISAEPAAARLRTIPAHLPDDSSARVFRRLWGFWDTEPPLGAEGAIVHWECPACGREFGRQQQSHVCVPAMPLADYLASQRPELRPVYQAVLDRVDAFGPVVVEPVGVGILLKSRRTFAELRPRRGRIACSVVLSRTLEHPRVVRMMRTSPKSPRRAYFVDLRSVDDVDEELVEWLRESYDECSADRP